MRRIARHRWTPLEDSLNIDRARSDLLTLRDELRFDATVFYRGMDIQMSPRCVKVAIGPEFIYVSDLTQLQKSPFHLSGCAIAYGGEIPSKS